MPPSSRSWIIPAGVDESRINAYSDNGMLEIIVKEGAAAKSHRIEIGDKPE